MIMTKLFIKQSTLEKMFVMRPYRCQQQSPWDESQPFGRRLREGEEDLIIVTDACK
jgi:hypothetical protein